MTGRCPPRCPRVGRQSLQANPPCEDLQRAPGVRQYASGPSLLDGHFAFWNLLSRVRGVEERGDAHSTDAASDVVAFCQGCQRGRVRSSGSRVGNVSGAN